MCRLQKISRRVYLESATTWQIDRRRDGQREAGQSAPYASQATQKENNLKPLNTIKKN